jgi:hypothetical protein
MFLKIFILGKIMSCAPFIKQKLPLVLIGFFLPACLSFQVLGQAATDCTIKISELFPRAAADCPEWFELVNTGGAAVSIGNWHFGHADDTALVMGSEYMVAPGAYIIVTKDKTLFSRKYPALTRVVQPQQWLTMDNYRDTLCLWDAGSVQCECVCWDYRWFDGWTGQSLERVSLQRSGDNGAAWAIGSSPSPGQPNASAALRDVAAAALDIGPVPFTPNGDAKDDYLSVTLSLPAATTASVSIYGFDGRKYLDLPAAQAGQFLWNGTDMAGHPAPIGPFFVVAEVHGAGQKTVLRKKGVLWR